ncbi:MAG: twin-arginine translocase TatA/TatE family subunit [Myxococcales bacterium]|nr:MAG: twin-arginine translocase TatA/TatE family subunit [Myxococcales bacterium]
MFGLGHWELIIILVIVLVVFGAGKLPTVGSALGKGIRNFKGSLKGEDDSPEGKTLDEKQKAALPRQSEDKSEKSSSKAENKEED